MVDNFSFSEGSGKTGAADDIGGVLYPRVKIAQGADGSATDVSSAAPLQVSLANHGANATAVKVDGSAVTQPVSAASLPLPTGASTETTLGTRLSESDFDTKVGSLTEAAPATDTASSGLNGRLQRIAQRLTSLIALVPAALTGSGNFKVAVQVAIPAGTNNIGDVDVLTQPARAATTDTITAKLATDAIMNGTTALTPKFAIIDAATSGDNTIIAAVASKKIRVLACFMVASAAVTTRFESGAAGTALTGQMNLAANGGFVLPFNPAGWFETASNTLLNLELSGATSVDGSIVYVEV